MQNTPGLNVGGVGSWILSEVKGLFLSEIFGIQNNLHVVLGIEVCSHSFLDRRFIETFHQLGILHDQRGIKIVEVIILQSA